MITAPLCVNCKHFKQDAPGLICDAFPLGIPDSVIESTSDHRKAIPGDNGIQFDPIDPKKNLPETLTEN